MRKSGDFLDKPDCKPEVNIRTTSKIISCEYDLNDYT